MAARTFDLLKAKDGKKASINGATQIRAGVIRPEIIFAEPEAEPQVEAGSAQWGRAALQEGDAVRLIRDPYFGLIGSVTALPQELARIPSESLARVLEVRLADGRKVVVPRANVEIIEE